METARRDASLKIGPVEMQQDLFERLVLPGLLWQPLVAVLVGLSSSAVDGADRALHYAKDLGAFPLAFLVVAAATTSIFLFSVLNEAFCQSLYHWGWLHRRAWGRAARGGRLPEILPYTAIDRSMHCSEPWPNKTFYQRFVAYLKSAVGAAAKGEERPARDYSGLAADVIHELLVSHVGVDIPGQAWAQFAHWRRLEQRLVRLSTSVPAAVVGLTVVLVVAICRTMPPDAWSAPLSASFGAIVGSVLVALAGIWGAAFLRGYYHVQTILAWAQGNNVLCRLFYAVWPRIQQQHGLDDRTTSNSAGP